MKRYPVFLRAISLMLVVLMVLTFTPPDVRAEKDIGPLLQEIEYHIERYYLYEPEVDMFPLESLDDLSRVFVDSHSDYLTDEQFQVLEDGLGQFFHGIGVYLEMDEFRATVVNTVPGSPAERFGLKEGDIIEEVNGYFIEGMTMEEVTSLIRGEEGTRVKLLVRRNNSLLNYIVPREKIKLPTVEYSWIEEGLALVTIYNFNLETGQDMEDTLQELKDQGVEGIILDLRSNFGGYVEEALEVASLFVEGTLLKVREKEDEWKTIETDRQARLNVPVIILLNLGTASAAEMLSAALKDSGLSLLVGGVSFGKGTIQTLFPMQEGGYLKLTTAEFLAPGGSLIEETGVEPHFFVFHPGKQMEKARSLLMHSVEQERPSFNYIKAGLEGMRSDDDSTPLPVQLDNKTYFPLRATLALTGRTIYTGDIPGEYFFYWENRRYVLKLPERTLSWNNPRGESFQEEFKLLNQTSYVSADFLCNALWLPGFPATDN